MSAEVKQTYAYWIRNEATNSQLEAIRSQHDELVRELARLRTERDALRGALIDAQEAFEILASAGVDDGWIQVAPQFVKANLAVIDAALLSADTAGQEREG